MTLIEKQDCDHAYILATYTAMLEFRDILAQRHAVGKGWTNDLYFSQIARKSWLHLYPKCCPPLR